MPGYKVKMGFGLHQGWAIEGAIGSFFKIDASYLSPNVNMASRLEAATKQFGVPLLVSGDLHYVLTPEVKLLCREIDCVTVKGSIKPVKLFTVDIDVEGMEVISDRLDGMTIKQKKKVREGEKKEIMWKLMNGKRTTWDIFERDKEFKELRKQYDPNFTSKFEEGYKNYIQGDWKEAGRIFDECLLMKPTDGPTLSLKGILEGDNYQAPKGWKGFRELTEK